MPKCDRCYGRGEHQHRRYGFWEMTKCRKCHGFGYTGFQKVEEILTEISIECTGKAKRLADMALKEIGLQPPGWRGTESK